MSAAEKIPAPAPKRRLTRADYDRYLPLVRRTAMKLARRLPSHVTVSDLVSYGWVGLCDAFERAPEGMTEDEFEAFAMFRVRGAALDHLRSLDPATRSARAMSRKVAKAMGELTSKSDGKTPEEEDVARKLGMSVADYRTAMEKLGKSGMDKLEMLDIDETPVATPAELQEDLLGKKQMQAVVAKAIKQLPERHQLVLALYYQEERTLREIGTILDISESRVCQIHTEAVHRLRAAAGKE
ncbi:MAG: RNA polymerase sigma factor FliA [Labilithrix sp.]|nr:RNA polymerase sigma factor FliA [Labilithrix sp.]MCW5817169.1 RNA polymerase sigma factor FliA [Labilithrix sp.]